ncbi:MAG: GNAT family N-acetyltransferase [Eggerthellaceae bacterium]|nr:GNAT family N-acetyltransferase [Eggerthellaceae bacterium]
MQLPGLVTVDPANEELAVKLAQMGGDAFLEELWTRELLSGLPEGSRGGDRERFLSRAIIMNDIAVGAPYQAVYCLEDAGAMAVAYLKSDLEGLTWNELEAKASRDLAETVLSDEEAAAFAAQLKRMAPISVFDWEEREQKEGDFIHFVMLAVDPALRGTGRFRRLVTPFFDYADEHGIPCYLETYSDQLQELYEHIGFTVAHVFESPEFSITERAMVRAPREAR